MADYGMSDAGQEVDGGPERSGRRPGAPPRLYEVAYQTDPSFVLSEHRPPSPTLYVIRAWWTSSSGYVTDLESAPGIG